MPAVAPADDSLLGHVLADKYRVVRQIGRGGMGVVYEAEHIGLGKRVAIKLMLEKYAQDTEAIARFQREALAASRIGNPHIIDVSDIGIAPDGRSFVVMELLNGVPLAHLLEVGGPLPPRRAVNIMRQVLRAVGAAHSKGIIHRDLKPDNIFLVNNGNDGDDFIKLLDFGISKVVDLDEQVALTRLTTTGVVMGTPLYMAPEQAMGNPVERYADLYACGVILYELLAGKPPFEGATYAVLVAKLLTSPPPLLSDVRPGLPDKLVRAVHHALEKDPASRFRNAELFAAALPFASTPSEMEAAGTMHDSNGMVARVPGAERVARAARPRAKRTWIAAAAAFVVAAGVTGVIVTSNRDPAPEPAASKGTLETVPRAGATPNVPLDPLPTNPAPVIATGTLEIQSIPNGATVVIDGKAVGTAPIAVTLPIGPHKVQIELAEFVGIDMEQNVRSNERTSIVLPLQRSVIAPVGSRPTRQKSGTKSGPANPYAVTQPPGARTVTTPPVDVTPKKAPVDDDAPKAKTGGTKPNPY